MIGVNMNAVVTAIAAAIRKADIMIDEAYAKDLATSIALSSEFGTVLTETLNAAVTAGVAAELAKRASADTTAGKPGGVH